MDRPTILIVMGVSGCGKTTIGRMLANELGKPYFDGDDYHPKNNVLKMSIGAPLNDADRQEWLSALNKLAINNSSLGAIIACSALKEKYRNELRKSIEDSIQFIYLQGTFKEVHERMKKRKDHFMPVGLLKSQFETLEPPEKAITISINNSPKDILREILNQLKQKKTF